MSFYRPKGITFIPTYECTSYCPHCNVDYNNIKNFPKMDVDFALHILHEAKKIGINGVQFSGGEPTLHPDLMINVYKKAKSLSMKIHRSATNGSLGNTPQQAHLFFKQLKQIEYHAGFRLSIDKYHCKDGIKTQAKFLHIFSDYFSFRNLSIGCCFKDRNDSSQLLVKLLHELKNYNIESSYNPLDKQLFLQGEKVKVGYWAPTRPSWQNLPDEEFNFKIIPQTMHGCIGEKGVGYLWIEPEGDLRICCGNANIFIDDLLVGNLKEEKLSHLIKKINQSKIFYILATEGPGGLVRIIREKDQKLLPLDKKYTHKCELCWEIFTSQEMRKILQKGVNSLFHILS